MKTFGGKLGCFTAFLITAAFAFPLLFGLAWSGSHCEPVPQCQRENEQYFGTSFAILLALAAVTGVSVTWIVNRLAARRDDEGTSATFVSVTIAAVLLGSLALIAAAFQLFLELSV